MVIKSFAYECCLVIHASKRIFWAISFRIISCSWVLSSCCSSSLTLIVCSNNRIRMLELFVTTLKAFIESRPSSVVVSNFLHFFRSSCISSLVSCSSGKKYTIALLRNYFSGIGRSLVSNSGNIASMNSRVSSSLIILSSSSLKLVLAALLRCLLGCLCVSLWLSSPATSLLSMHCRFCSSSFVNSSKVLRVGFPFADFSNSSSRFLVQLPFGDDS